MKYKMVYKVRTANGNWLARETASLNSKEIAEALTTIENSIDLELIMILPVE